MFKSLPCIRLYLRRLRLIATQFGPLFMHGAVAESGAAEPADSHILTL